MLRKYTPDPAQVVDWGELGIDADGTFEEGPMLFLDSRDQVLRRKTVTLVREVRFSSPDGWSIKEDHPDVRGQAIGMCPGS